MRNPFRDQSVVLLVRVMLGLLLMLGSMYFSLLLFFVLFFLGSTYFFKFFYCLCILFFFLPFFQNMDYSFGRSLPSRFEIFILFPSLLYFPGLAFSPFHYPPWISLPGQPAMKGIFVLVFSLSLFVIG